MRTLVTIALLSGCTLQASLGKTEGESSPEPAKAFGPTRWSTLLATGDEHVDPNGIAFAPDGDVIAGGTRWTAGDDMKGFVTRHAASDGAAEWTRILGTAPASSQIFAVATAVDDSVIVVGSFNGSVDFGGETLTTTIAPDMQSYATDLFVAKYGGDGTLAWVRALGCSVLASGYGVAVDSSSIYVAGWFRGLVDVGQGPVGKASDWELQQDGLLLAYSHAGELRWGHTFSDGSSGGDVVILPGGDLVVGGSTAGSSFGGGPLTPGGLLARFGADGTHRWSQTVAPDAGYAPWLAATEDRIIASYSVVGLNLWKSVYSVVDMTGTPVLTDAALGTEDSVVAALSDGFVLAGSFARMSIDLGTGPVSGGVYVAAYDAAGIAYDVRTFGAFSSAKVSAVATDANSIAFTALVRDPVDFGTGVLERVGARSTALVVLERATE